MYRQTITAGRITGKVADEALEFYKRSKAAPALRSCVEYSSGNLALRRRRHSTETRLQIRIPIKSDFFFATGRSLNY
jgi:hypothetical protein